MNCRPLLRHRARRAAAVAAVLVAAVALSPGVAAGVAAGAGTGVASPRSGPAHALTDGTAKGSTGPLAVRLTRLSPSFVPTSRPLRLAGTVTNTSKEDWQEINVHVFVSRTPITSSAALAQAAALPYDADVGGRLQTTHAFVGIGDLAPGQTARFSLRVPRSELPIPERPGVYWVGAHALGADKDGRDGVADGRARTFIPLIRAKRPRASLALVLPFRETVRRDATGNLRNPERWQRLLAPSGRLGRLLLLAESAGSDPLTLVVDPAVLDAVDTVANGSADPGTPTPDGSPGASPSASPSENADGSDDAAKPTGAAADAAKDWLARFKALAGQKRVLGLGYADPDVASLSSRSPALIGKAYALGAAAFKQHQVAADPAALPADGHLPQSALSSLDSDTAVVLDDTAVPGRRSRWTTTSGQPLVVADAGAADGGPGPTSPTQALAMRQRIASEAALRAMSGSEAPLVVALPARWDPGKRWPAADFFGALELPWLQLSGVDTMGAAPTRTRLSYPADRAAAEIGGRQVAATSNAIRAAGTYADALTTPDEVIDSFTRQALEGASYHARTDPGTSLEESVDLARSIRDRLSGIRVVGSSFVTMSGGSGSFVVTLVNELRYPVRVGLRAHADSTDLKISTPPPVVLPPGQRTTVRLGAKASDIGVRRVRLTPVTREGDAVGTPVTFSVRSSQVSSLIWGVMIAGGTLLVVMIVRRAVKRGLRRENVDA